MMIDFPGHLQNRRCLHDDGRFWFRPAERLIRPALVKPGINCVKGAFPMWAWRAQLAGALDTFRVDPSGLNCLDVGCSTGSFTDCLFKRGAAHVLSVDVGRAQFDWSLRQDERVTLLERTNIVDVPELGYRSSADLAVCDVSFTSIATILPAVLELLTPSGAFLTLVKPQFEAPQGEVGRAASFATLPCMRGSLPMRSSSSAKTAFPLGLCASPITGAKGNREFFLLGARGIRRIS
ncbi:MAG: SAM-dependent methyltransferase [Collinsella intestinalis]